MTPTIAIIGLEVVIFNSNYPLTDSKLLVLVAAEGNNN